MNLENYGIKLEPVNSNELRLIMPNLNFIIEKFDNSRYIKSVKIGEICISSGDCFNCNVGEFSIYYKANYISCHSKYPKVITLNNFIDNDAMIFLPPLLFDNRSLASYIEFIGGKYCGYLMNCYIDCDFIQKRDEYSIFMLLKFSKSDRFKIQENYFFNHKCFVRNHDIHGNYVLYEFSIPAEFRRDYLLLLDGKYSQINGKTKNAIIRFHESHIYGGIANKIMNKDIAFQRKLESQLGVNFKDIFLPDEEYEVYSRFGNKEILTNNML